MKEYSLFKSYNDIYEINKVKYSDMVIDLENDLSEDIYLDDRSIEITKKSFDFYISHPIARLRKDYSQGLNVSIFNINVFVLAILLFCGASICEDRRKKLIDIQFSTKAHKWTQFNIKLLVMITGGVLIFIINLAFSWLLSLLVMGGGELTGQMNSIRAFNLSPITRNIRMLFSLKIILGIITILFSVIFFTFISTLSQNIIMVYTIGCISILTSNIFYYGILPLKYSALSFFYGVDSFLYGSYLYNIQIALITLMLQIIIIYWISYRVYSRNG